MSGASKFPIYIQPYVLCLSVLSEIAIRLRQIGKFLVEKGLLLHGEKMAVQLHAKFMVNRMSHTFVFNDSACLVYWVC